MSTQKEECRLFLSGPSPAPPYPQSSRVYPTVAGSSGSSSCVACVLSQQPLSRSLVVSYPVVGEALHYLCPKEDSNGARRDLGLVAKLPNTNLNPVSGTIVVAESSDCELFGSLLRVN